MLTRFTPPALQLAALACLPAAAAAERALTAPCTAGKTRSPARLIR